MAQKPVLRGEVGARVRVIRACGQRQEVSCGSHGGDTRVTPEDKRRAAAQRAAEVAERRAVFDANNNN